MRQPNFLQDTDTNILLPPRVHQKTSFDMEDLTVKLHESANLKINDTNSQGTKGLGTNSTRTKEDDDYNMSFDEDFFFDFPMDDEETTV
jgi:hypothetical protein